MSGRCSDPPWNKKQPKPKAEGRDCGGFSKHAKLERASQKPGLARQQECQNAGDVKTVAMRRAVRPGLMPVRDPVLSKSSGLF